MAFSYVKYSGDGSTHNFSVPFPFLERQHVAVTVFGDEVPFTWISDGQVSITAAPATGTANVMIRRHTPSDVPTFSSPTNFASTTLNTAFRQLLYVTQEAYDMGEEGAAVGVDVAELLASLEEQLARAEELVPEMAVYTAFYYGASASAPAGSSFPTGSRYFNTTHHRDYVWTGSAWEISTPRAVPFSFTGDGSTTTFTLPEAPNSVYDVLLWVEGIKQPVSVISLAGTSMTLSAAPHAAARIDGVIAMYTVAAYTPTPAFGTVAVAGQSDVVADSTSDVLTLAAGAGVSITTNSSTDTITVSLTGSDLGDDVAALQQEVLQLYLMQSVTGSLAAGGFVNGGYDTFSTDTIGANSTGHLYSSAAKTYANVSFATTTTAYTTVAGSGDAGWVMLDNSLALGNSRTITAIGVYSTVAQTMAVKLLKLVSGSTWQVVHSQAVSHSGGGWQDFTLSTPQTLDGSSTYRAGVWGGGSNYPYATSGQGLTYQTSNTSSDPLTSGTGTFGTGYGPGAATPILRFTYQAGPYEMTLVSGSLSPAPSAAPTSVVVDVLAAYAGTLGTDLKVYATRNGGTTWSEGTLTDTGVVLTGGYALLKAVVDVSGQSSGTTIKYKITTTASYTQTVKGVALVYK